jgi:hypothetical protein
VAARVEGPSGDLDPDQVGVVLDRGVRLPGAEAVGEGQHREQQRERREREQQGGGVRGGHGTVDDHADHHRHQCLGGLVGTEQGGAHGQPADLPAQRTAQDAAPGHLVRHGRAGQEAASWVRTVSIRSAS